MFFRINSTSPVADLAIYRAKRTARIRLALFRLGPAEVLLSRYLLENHNLTLQQACINILQNARFNLNIKREIIVTIPDPELNNLAKLITYGTGKIQGSKILKDMLQVAKGD